MTEPIVVSEGPAQPSRQRLFLLAGVGVGLLVVVFLATSVLFGGDGGGKVAEDDSFRRPAATTTVPTGSGGRETFEVYSSKNPFEPPEGVGVPGGPTTTVPGGGGPTTTVPGATGDGTAPRPRQRVALLEVFDEGGERVASIRVNDTVYRVSAGEQFAGSYEVVSLAEDCGRFLFGDSAFELCVGDEILK